jgi:uncharacterized membrane protein
MKALLLILLLIPFVSAELVINIDLSEQGTVREDVTMYISGDYDRVQYTSLYKPISVDYDGDYIVEEQDGAYVLDFPYRNITTFSLLYDGMVTSHGATKSYRSGFVSNDPISLSVTLPRYYTLSKEPSAIPKPDSTTTDGQRIRLHWKLDKGSDITVFFESQKGALPFYIWIAIAVVVLAAIGLVIYFLTRTRKRMKDMLSDDETKVLELISKENRQDRIAKTLVFSKSKMSKVVRKLEEKNLVSKEAYFKTNILKRR